MHILNMACIKMMFQPSPIYNDSHTCKIHRINFCHSVNWKVCKCDWIITSIVTFQLPFSYLWDISVTFESPFSYLSFTDQLPFSFFSADSQNGTVSSCIVTRYIALKPLCNHYMNLKTIIQGVCSILPPPPKFSY